MVECGPLCPVLLKENAGGQRACMEVPPGQDGTCVQLSWAGRGEKGWEAIAVWVSMLNPFFFHCIFSAWFLHVSSFVIGLEALVDIDVALLSWSCPWLTGFVHHQCSGMPPLVSSHMSGGYPRKQFDHLVFISQRGKLYLHTKHVATCFVKTENRNHCPGLCGSHCSSTRHLSRLCVLVSPSSGLSPCAMVTVGILGAVRTVFKAAGLLAASRSQGFLDTLALPSS